MKLGKRDLLQRSVIESFDMVSHCHLRILLWVLMKTLKK